MNVVDITAVLEQARVQLDPLRGSYERALEHQTLSDLARAQIKNIVENQRSALEYTAAGITDKWGKGPFRYYPMASSDADFAVRFAKNMPGVAEARDDIRDVIFEHQPYKLLWLKHLSVLSRENKHTRLTPQTRSEVRRRRAGAAEWDPKNVTFGKGIVVRAREGGGLVVRAGQGGGIVVRPDGVFIEGERVDEATQRTPATVDITYVDWLFTDLGVSAFSTLSEIQQQVTPLIQRLIAMADL